MWKTVQNANAEQPQEIDETSSSVVVYIRRNFKQITQTDDIGGETGTGTGEITVWQYEENEIPKTDWELYKQALENKEQITETEQMLTDLDIANLELSARIDGLEGDKT